MNVILCALASREERLLNIVFSRLGERILEGGKVRFLAVGLERAEQGEIAIVDANSERSLTKLGQLRESRPGFPAILISDDGKTGNSPFLVKRSALLMSLQPTLKEALLSELSSSPKTNRRSSFRRNRIAMDPPPRARIPAEQSGLNHAGTEPFRALVVDDSAVIREQIQTALKQSGIHSVGAENADAAAAQLAVGTFDLILLDVVMPGTNGYDFCRRLKKDPYNRSTPVILLTSKSSPFDRARGALVGCESYLVKPVTASAFYSTVQAALLKRSRDGVSGLIARGYRTMASGR